MRNALIALALGTFVACSTDEPWNPPDQPAVDAAYTDCSGGQTCVVVELGCCDHCNGGSAIAVIEGQQATATAEYGETCGNRLACTEIGCAPLTAVCNEGTCGLMEGEL